MLDQEREQKSRRDIPMQYEAQTPGCNLREMTDEEKIGQIFTYHPATPYTGPKFENLREAAHHFAKVILLNVPRGADRTAAIRHVRDAVMTANAGVSLDGMSL